MTVQNKILTQCYESFMKYGVRSVSMDDIARSMGMSKKTIYSFFDKKDGLVHKAVKYFIKKDEEEITALIEQSTDAIDEMVNIARHVLIMLRKMSPSVVYDLKKYHPETWDVINETHFEFIFKTIRNNLERGISEGFYRSDINIDIVSRFYVQLSHTVADTDVFPHVEFDRSILFKELIHYHLYSILTPEGKNYFNQKEI